MSIGRQRPARRLNGSHRSIVLLGAVVAVLAITAASGCGETHYTEQEHLQRAVEFQQEGDLAASVIELKNVLQQNPDNAEARWRLGTIYQRQGETADARHHLERAEELGWTDEDAEAATGSKPERIAHYLSGGEYQRALESARRLVEQRPGSAYSHVLVGLSLMGLERLDAAVEAFEQALEVDPANRLATNNLAVIAVTRGQPEAARERFQSALEHDPESLHLLMDFADFEAHHGSAKRTHQLVQRAMEAHPEALRPRVIAARYYVNTDEPDRALEVLEPIRERFAEAPAWLNVHARALLENGDTKQAIEALRRLVELTPERPAAAHQLGMALNRAGRTAEAREAFEQALDIDDDHVPSLSALAQLRLAEDDADGAMKLASRLRRLEGGKLSGRLVEGRAAMQRGEPARAAESLEAAYAMQPNTDIALLVHRAYREAGERDAGNMFLTRHLERFSGDDRARLVLGVSLLERNEYQHAIAHLNELAGRYPDNAAIANNLAFALHETGDPRALEVARKGHRLAPDDPHVQDTLGVILLDTGEAGEALALLQAAHAGLPDEPAVRFHLARALAADDRPDQAREHLEALLSDDRSFRGREDARALLERLK